MNTYRSNPNRCATPDCLFYAVVPFGLCEYCEAEANPVYDPREKFWLDWNFERIEREAREAYWQTEGSI